MIIDIILIHPIRNLSKKNPLILHLTLFFLLLNRSKKSPQKKLSTNRTVLLSKHSIISNENQSNTDILKDNQNDSQEEPKFKRPKIDSSPLHITDNLNTINETDQTDLGIKSIVNVSVINNDHDCRHDLNEKRRISGASNTSIVPITENIKTKSSRSRSRSKSKDRHREQRRSSTNSHSSSKKDSKLFSKSNNYSRSSSNDNQHRREQQQKRNNHQHERKRSPNLPNHHHKQYSNHLPDRHDLFHQSSFRNSVSSMYHQHDIINDLTLPGNFHLQRQPVRHKRFNYNHQSVADHPRFSNPNVLLTSAPLMDFDYPKSPTRHHSISPMPIGDRK